MNFESWKGFESGTWTREINVRSFIRHNFTPYDGNESFLEKPMFSRQAQFPVLLKKQHTALLRITLMSAALPQQRQRLIALLSVVPVLKEQPVSIPAVWLLCLPIWMRRISLPFSTLQTMRIQSTEQLISISIRFTIRFSSLIISVMMFPHFISILKI
mgnify:CR=1 FL=1